jgi:hypothetical protein
VGVCAGEGDGVVADEAVGDPVSTEECWGEGLE